jgi:hypothetical protein
VKETLILLFILIGFSELGIAQKKQVCTNFDWLLGNWVSTSTMNSTDSLSTFSFTYDLANKVYVRKSHFRLPFSEKKIKARHNNLLFIYPDIAGCPTTAKYFDNEKHHINFTVTYEKKMIVFTSDPQNGFPTFKLTYSQPKSGEVTAKFEIASDGTQFTTILQEVYKKKL